MCLAKPGGVGANSSELTYSRTLAPYSHSPGLVGENSQVPGLALSIVLKEIRLRVGSCLQPIIEDITRRGPHPGTHCNRLCSMVSHLGLWLWTVILVTGGVGSGASPFYLLDLMNEVYGRNA